jgi:hypothetical protein
MLRFKRGIQYAGASPDFTDVAGILHHLPQCAIARKAGDDSLELMLRSLSMS